MHRTQRLCAAALVTLLGLGGLSLASPLSSPAHAADPPEQLLLVMDSSGSMAEKTADGTSRIDADDLLASRVVAPSGSSSAA